MQTQSGPSNRIAILHRHERVFRLSTGAEVDYRATTVAQFQVAGDKVCVEVGEKNVADPKSSFISVVKVLLDVSLRINDDGGRTGLVSK